MIKLALFAGDGIGVEVATEAVNVLKFLFDLNSIRYEIEEDLVGGASYDEYKKPITEKALKLAKDADAVIFGAVGGYKWESLPIELRPEKALLTLRYDLGLYVNLRPAKVYSELIDASPLKKDIVNGTDMIIIRELTGGIYFGQPRGIFNLGDGQRKGVNTLTYTTKEITRIAKTAFEIAEKRRKKVLSVDKANVLESTELWREVVADTAKNYPDVELSNMYVDNCSMQLIRQPKSFDIILAPNMFGDILSDEASMIAGSIGMLPSASLNGKKGMYEPIHGSAPDIAGQNKANPIAAILSAAMMLRYSFDMGSLAERIENAVTGVIRKGYRTPDIYSDLGIGETKLIGTKEMGAAIIAELKLKG
ncbi:3-isopropylmalate dehydrogenase [Candidatus Acidulodesulfobacterium sp. H_13]|uniref:3-isopropylmalate dehydrogenase n=1 Tax=Candidatus Acidulodesulfobacterium sp. H_13 TaxID=3395470 RepID=UPI003AF83DE3